jgi:hypothetical protein
MSEVRTEAMLLIMTAPANGVVSLSGCFQRIATQIASRHGSSAAPESHEHPLFLFSSNQDSGRTPAL